MSRMTNVRVIPHHDKQEQKCIRLTGWLGQSPVTINIFIALMLLRFFAVLIYEHIPREEQDTALCFKAGVLCVQHHHFLLSLEASKTKIDETLLKVCTYGIVPTYPTCVLN